MPISRPTSDINAQGWINQTGGSSNLFSTVNESVRDDTTFAETTITPVPQPQRVLHLILDDARWDMINGRMGQILYGDGTPHPRSNQRCMEWFLTNVYPKCANFTGHRATQGPCWTTRCEIQTGLFYLNHGYSPTSGGASAEYLNLNRVGIKNSTKWQGPWEVDLAGRAGLPRTPTDPRVVQTGKRDSDDDPQAFSGGIMNWLARENVKCAVIGKWQNGDYSTIANTIPPGVTYAFITEAPGQPAHWQTNSHEFSGSNPWDGTGATTGVSHTYFYNVGPPSKMEWSSGVSKVTCSGHTLQIGDEVAISGSPDNTYNGLWIVTARTSTTFSFANSNAGTTVTSGFTNCKIGDRKFYESELMAQHSLTFLSGVSDTDPWYIYLTPRWVHINSDNTYNNTNEIRYDNTVSTADGFYFNGVPGAFSPAGPSLTYSTQSTINNELAAWAKRQQMQSSVDDMLREVLTYVISRWGDSWTLILTSDNGEQIGEQDVRNDDGVLSKTAIWEGCARMPLYIKSALIPSGTYTFPTTHCDEAPTILDMFGISDHHVHTKRDGYSIIRLLDPTDPVAMHGRVLPIWGIFADVQALGYVDQTNTKFLNRSGTLRWFNVNPATEYELTGHTLTGAQLATYNTKIAIINSRWNVATNINPARTI